MHADRQNEADSSFFVYMQKRPKRCHSSTVRATIISVIMHLKSQ
jgi:hypothetical protein